MSYTPCIHLGMFYYTLGNLRPELRSTQRSIQLIACVTSPLLVKYGFESILKPFINDVNILATVSHRSILCFWSKTCMCKSYHYVH